MSKERDLLMKIIFDKELAKREEEHKIECCLDSAIIRKAIEKERDKLKCIKPTSLYNAG